MVPALDILPLVLGFFIAIGRSVAWVGELASGSPLPLGVAFIAVTLGVAFAAWWRAVGRRLDSGVRLRPIRPTPHPGSTPNGSGNGSAAEERASPAPPSVVDSVRNDGLLLVHANGFGHGNGNAPPSTSGPSLATKGPTGSGGSPNAEGPNGGGSGDLGASPPPARAAPSRPPPAPRGFGLKVTGFFALFAALLLYFSNAFFTEFNRAVAALGTALYWPFAWPGGGTVQSPTTTPDYIFLMYLSLFLAYGATYLASRRERLRPRQRNAAVLILAAYVFFALLLDVFFEGSSFSPFLASFTLLVRMLLGGLFLALLQFSTLVVPPPMAIERKFPRRRGAIAVLLASGAASIVAGLTVLYGAWVYLGIGRTLLQFAVLLLLPIYAYLFWILIGRVLYALEIRSRPVPPTSVYHPPVSFLIPAYQEEEGIAFAIRAADLAARTYPGSVEILVGNDGSTDRTSEIAHAEIAALRHATGRVLDLPHGGKASALNGMLRVATGEILVRVDADCAVDPEVGFGEMVRHFADPEVGAVQGVLLPLQSTGWVRKMRLLEICFNHLFLRRAQMAFGAAQVVDGAFCAFRRSDLLETGGWADWNGEDTEITIRLERLGYRTRFETGARAFEDVPATYAALKKQRIRWSRGGLFAHLRHYGSVFGDAPEFGGLALLVWLAMFTRGAMRHLVYLYAALATLLLGLPTLYHLFVIVLLLLLPRAVVLGYYLVRLGRGRSIPWIGIWPATGAMKQFFTVESFGTMLPGAIPEFSE
jgi:cellulose synthase/poly-beta-1,6-N-acetylglucosamine synthase-like glycosyltransferase